MKTDLFQSHYHHWVFQICWHIECSPFTPSSFRIWNSSTGIPSPPLALFVVMLPKAHLTSHSRIPYLLDIYFHNDKIYIGFWENKNHTYWVLGCNLKNDRMISVHFQDKPFNITVIQAYTLTSNTEEAEVEQLYEDLQDLLELTPKKRWPFHDRGLESKSKKSRYME